MKTVMNVVKKHISVLLILVLLFGCFACQPAKETETEVVKDDIVILFTNDIHSAVDGGLTLAGVAWYKKQMLKETPYVTLVDCGDPFGGSSLGTVSKGAVTAEAMKVVGFDYATLGNHEFDYGLERYTELAEMTGMQYVCCNIGYTGTGEDPFKDVEPYVIQEYGDVKVAFVGVITPNTLASSTPAYMQENGEYVVTFQEGDNGQNLYKCVQATVDEARAAGADYVIALAHLGNEDECINYRETDLIANTTGIDAVLDGHSHSTFTLVNVENKDGESVICAQTGTQLENLGQLVITAGGMITVTNVSDIAHQDEEAKAKIDEIVNKYSAVLDETVATANTTLPIKDENGARLVRNSETAIGNFCADAFRYVVDADVAYVNGGAIRAALNAGELSYSDIIALMPFGNMLCKVEITGAELAEILEFFVSKVQAERVDEDGNPVGENGSFPNMSGLTFTVDTSVESSIEVSDTDTLLSVGEARRVKDIKILQDGEYVPLDPEKTYTLALSDYVAKNGGSGMMQYLADNAIVLDSVMTDYQALLTYLTEGLNGDLSAYSEPQGRLVIEGRE